MHYMKVVQKVVYMT